MNLRLFSDFSTPAAGIGNTAVISNDNSKLTTTAINLINIKQLKEEHVQLAYSVS